MTDPEKPDKCDKLCVELHMAFMWDCPHCGTENFQRAITLRMSDEELRESDCPPEDFEKFRTAHTMPCNVKCRDCGKRFKAAEASDEDDTDEDR